MRLTDNPCHNCENRSAECRLTCARYKVYHAAKQREYEKKRQYYQEHVGIIQHIRETKEKYRKGRIKYTPKKNGGMKK